MRDSDTVSGHEIELRDDQTIVSRTDKRGRIVYINADFVEVSGFTEKELLGQSHNIVRHPDMPREVFADLWTDLRAGRPWVGLIKNRCKNGDAYWVEAHVSPIFEKGRITGYMSMRRKPSRAQIDAACDSYATIRSSNRAGMAIRHGSATTNTFGEWLRDRWADTSIDVKLFLSSLLAALVVLAGFSYLLADNLSKTLDEDARRNLRHDVSLVRAAVAARVENARLEADDHAEKLSARVYKALGGIRNASPAAIEALVRRASVNDGNPIETFLHDLKGTATIFVRTPAGFRRLMTSAIDESGGLPVGSLLAADHPALPALLAGNSYLGVARVFSRDYMTNYRPIIDASGTTVGATAIGIDLGEQLETLKNELRATRIGVSGYYYILNVASGPEFGRMILHPYKEGQLLGDAVDNEGRNLTAEMAKRRSGEMVYFWQNREAGETVARKKLTVFESLDNPHWVVAGGATIDELTALSVHVVWLVLAGGIALTVAIFAIMLILVRKLILKPLNSQVLPTFHAMSAGRFDTPLDVRGNDEMAQVIHGLESLRNRLAFENDRERTLSALREAARQEAETLSRVRAEFLANMSHEIRTPLNAVIGLAHLLLKSRLGQRDMEYVKRIEGAGKLLLAVVNDILDFSKIDAGKLQLEETSFRLDDVLDNLSNLVRTRVQEKGLVLEYVVGHVVPQALRGDALRLSQILINLVSNAIKFTAEGSVTVHINAGPARDGYVELEFRVQDTGIGMSDEQLAHLFQAFSQADSSVTRKFGGTGLGLAISKRLVEMMGGAIWVDSQPLKGSTFAFNAWLAIDESANLPAPTPTGYRVLVVDDNALARKVLERLLTNQGCHVYTEDSGDAALAALRKAGKPFDCVMVDLNMPEMDGLALAHHIRSDRHNMAKLVMVTGENVHTTRCSDALGIFDDILEKPVTAARLGEMLEQLRDGTAPAGRPAALPAPLAGLRVLVAEDVPTNQLIMRDLLESLGATVDVADNGLLALRQLATVGDHLDLILMDIQMPEMDGLEATRRIRAGQVRADIPIIALTAHALADERQRTVAAGMNDFLTKPIEPEQMVAVIQRWRPLAGSAGNTPGIAPPSLIPNLPELPGIDVAEGLHRMLNRLPLYEKVLRDFHGRFTGETGRIRAALAADDSAAASRGAHSLKGTGAMIGATALAALAAELDDAIRTCHPALSDCLERFDGELTRVLAGIAAAYLADRPPREAEAGPAENQSLRTASPAS